MEFDHEIISTVILLPSAESFKKGCCQLQAKVCARSTGYPHVQACPGKSVDRWTDHPAMTVAVDLGRKATKQTNIMKTWFCWMGTKSKPFIKLLTVTIKVWTGYFEGSLVSFSNNFAYLSQMNKFFFIYINKLCGLLRYCRLVCIGCQCIHFWQLRFYDHLIFLFCVCAILVWNGSLLSGSQIRVCNWK